MTGTVKSVSSKFGYVQADGGQVLYFQDSSVLSPGFDALEPGHAVTFDVDGKSESVAVDVLRHFEWGPDNPPLESGEEAPHLRYLGFEQNGSIRTHKYGAMSESGRFVTFEMNADIQLLTENHVRIQDAPVLCLRALESELTPEDWAALTPIPHTLERRHLP